jgi:hypothetical protein
MLKIQVKGGVAELLLDHPPVNGLTVAILNRPMSGLRELGETVSRRRRSTRSGRGD